MRTLPRADGVAAVAHPRRLAGLVRRQGNDLESRGAVEPGEVVTQRHAPPILQLPRQPQRVRAALELPLLADLREVVRLGPCRRQTKKLGMPALRCRLAELDRQRVLDLRVADFVFGTERQAMNRLIHGLGRRINGARLEFADRHAAPLLRGQAAVAAKAFVGEIELRRVAPGQAGGEPDALVVEVRRIGQAERRVLHAVEPATGAEAKLAPRLVADLHVAQAGTVDAQPRQVILVATDIAAVELDVRATLGLAGGGDLAKPERESLGHSPVLAKRLLAAADRDVPSHRLGGENSFNRLRPRRALVDPAANQANLLAAQGRCFAFRRHLRVLDQAGDNVDERAVGAVAGQDRHAEFAALKRRLAARHPEVTLGPLFTVALEAGTLQQRLDVGGEIDFALGGHRQFACIDRFLRHRAHAAQQDGQQRSHQYSRRGLKLEPCTAEWQPADQQVPPRRKPV